MIDQLILATHNQGKVKEFQEMLGPCVESLRCAADFCLPEPEETGATFVENAFLKARAAVAETGLPCLADDSGLAVDSLGGSPGIYSARWAGPEKDFGKAMQRVYEELKDHEDKSAAFVAVLALVFPDGQEEVFEGRVAGDISWPPRGSKGFGYDPIFVPEGFSVTFAEMDSNQKHTMSHRFQAVEKLKTFLSTYSLKTAS